VVNLPENLMVIFAVKIAAKKAEILAANLAAKFRTKVAAILTAKFVAILQ
jgi:hypothetical protein